MFTLLVLLFFLEILIKKKSSEKKSSENNQSTGHFQSFFFSSPDPKSEKNPENQLIKKFWPKREIVSVRGGNYQAQHIEDLAQVLMFY